MALRPVPKFRSLRRKVDLFRLGEEYRLLQPISELARYLDFFW